MKNQPPQRLVFLLALLAIGLVPSFGGGATYVLGPDTALVEGADLVVEGRVTGTALSARPGATTYLVEIERVLLGWAPGSTLPVRVVGSDSEVRQDLRGIPRFVTGDRVILFLVARPDGQWGILHLAMGAFHQVEVEGRRFALRLLDDAEVLASKAGVAEAVGAVRDWEMFSDWIGRRANGEEAPESYLVARSAAVIEAGWDKYTFLRSSGTPIRWFVFDSGGSVTWMAMSGGQSGVTGGGFGEFQAALGTWSGSVAQVNLRYGGTTGSSDGFESPDGKNTLLFDDPNDDMPGRFSCVGGGTLAIGGPWFSTSSPGTWKGTTFFRALEGDIITNDGIGCFFLRSPNGSAAARELFGHELGHTLGLGHSCGDNSSGPCVQQVLDEALMRASIHDDGRGAALNADDRAGIQFLYRPTSGGGGGGGGGGIAAPTNLSVSAVTASEVTLEWTDASTNEIGFRVERSPAGAGAFVEVAQLPAGTTSFGDSGLASATAYTWRVRAAGSSNFSGYSNEATATTLDVPPLAPEDLRATVLSSGHVQVSWLNRALNASGLRIEARRIASSTSTSASFAYVGGQWETVMEPGIGPNAVLLPGWAPGELYNLRVVAVNAVGEGVSEEAPVAMPDASVLPCAADGARLCLFEDRFTARVLWRTPAGATGAGIASGLTDKSGTFAFFNPANIELVVKVLDGRPINASFWHFYGALSNVEYWIVVTDGTNGLTRSYYNPQNEFCGAADVAAFVAAGLAEGTASSSELGSEIAAVEPRVMSSRPDKGTEPCVAGEDTLCLGGGRFEVRVELIDPTSGNLPKQAKAVEAGVTSGYFWFFNPANIELVVKVLDGRPINGHFWVFFGALSNVEYTVSVRDTETGNDVSYVNPQGTLCGQADTQALPGS